MDGPSLWQRLNQDVSLKSVKALISGEEPGGEELMTR